MTREIRNLKGEIVREEPGEGAWWKFSAGTWLLIAGLVLFNIGCFVNPSILDGLFRSLDVRLWPWWYFIPLTILIVFAARWYVIALRYEDYDEYDQESAKRFLRMSIFITALGALLILLNAVNVLWRFTDPLKRWFAFGEFSLMALIAFIGTIVILIPLLYFVKEWLVTFWRPDK